MSQQFDASNMGSSVTKSSAPYREMSREEAKELINMLRYKRPHGSKTEQAFVSRFIDPLPGIKSDAFGNRYVAVPNPDGSPSRVMWACHTDTVHRKGGKQYVVYNPRSGMMYLPETSKSNCLGADDTAGVWLMSHMIRLQVPGLYIFHRGEEVGGLGSSWIAANDPDRLAGIDIAIALDRRGYNSVITYQTTRGCSETFASTLAARLGGHFEPDDTGLFTDTDNYTHLVPECTNLSVGYFDAHSKAESLDAWFLRDLLDRLCDLETESLPVCREPSAYDPDDWPGFWGGSYRDRGEPELPLGYSKGALTREDERDEWKLMDLVMDHPEVAASVLEDMGFSRSDFLEAVYARTGKLDRRAVS